VVLAAAIVAALTAAPGALAHAVLEESDPANETVVESSPPRVSMRFNEPVETSFGSIRVYDADLQQVDDGSVERPSTEEVAVGLRPDLPDGTYTVTWRVVSGDSHPVGGAFVFHVGAPSPGVAAGGVAGEVQGQSSPGYVSGLLTGTRFLDFALILALAGGAIALAVVVREADETVRGRLLALLGILGAALAVVAPVGIVLQGAKAGGTGVNDALDWSVIRTVLDTRFGQVWLAQAAAGLAIVYLVLGAQRLRGRAREWAASGALVVAVLLVLAPAASGHARVSGPVSFVADVAHVEAASAWTGGLLFLLLAIRAAGVDRWRFAADAVPRFSTLAVLSVAVLVVAGAVNGFLQVRAWSGLWETTYGVLLLVKVGLVLPILALGLFNNRVSVPRLRAGLASAFERRRFLRTTGLELGLVVAVVAVTAVLVAEPPAKAQIGVDPGPYSTVVDLGEGIELNLQVDPARTGANDIHLYTTDRNGQPADLLDFRVSASLETQGVGPLRFDASPAGPGHAAVYGARFPASGDWRLVVEARRGEFEGFREELSVPIGKDT
jgi:copper transport protein